MDYCDILVIGAGAAGISAAAAAAEAGAAHVCLVDAKPAPGGVLRQCAHHGFGEGDSGPEYVARLWKVLPANVEYRPQTTVLSLDKTCKAQLCAPMRGRYTLTFRQVVLASGCYEIPIGALTIAGTRPKGVYTAGQMQEMMNLHHYCPQGPVVILGSGDLGLLMAAQLAAQQLSVTLIERKPQCGGLARHQVCLENPYVQLRCQITIEKIFGDPTLSGVLLSDGTYLPCRTLLIAVGLRPERTLIESVDVPSWLHLAGNCHYVHTMIGSVVEEGRQAGIRAYTHWRNEQ